MTVSNSTRSVFQESMFPNNQDSAGGVRLFQSFSTAALGAPWSTVILGLHPHRSSWSVEGRARSKHGADAQMGETGLG